jgi:formylglycine-generating enzyme required for sulfatase activity
MNNKSTNKTDILFALLSVIFLLGSPAKAQQVSDASFGFDRSNTSEKRVALVIGNAAYKSAPLKNPVNDAKAITKKLQEFNFDVIEIVNQNRIDIYKAIRRFGEKLKNADVGFFYYAGHGMQVNGENYLIPVNSLIESEDEVPYNAINASEILAKMESARSSVNIVVLDACRNNPFPSSFRSSSRGLARIDAPIGSLIVYSTAPGQVAADGDGDNGLFTNFLLKQMSKPGVNIRDVIMATRADVIEATNGIQVPWESSSLINKFYFSKLAAPTQSALQLIEQPIEFPATELSQPRQVSSNLSNELAVWRIVRDTNDPAELRVFLATFSNGMFAKVAAEKLKALGDTSIVSTKPLFIDTSPSNTEIVLMNSDVDYRYGIEMPVQQYQVKITAEGYQATTQIVDLGAKESFYFALEELKQSEDSNLYKISSVEFRMVDIPSGSFLRGDSSRKSAQPLHTVNLQAFQLMESEVTWQLYDLCIQAGKCDPKDNRSAWDSEFRPAIRVSWNEIIHQFIPWINQQTGQIFRLPSESEWEYAARAGTSTAYFWGSKIKCSHARFNGGRSSDCYYKDKNRDYLGTIDVKSFTANPFGVYDMQGNVSEWVQDCRKSNYNNVPTSGEAYLAGDCEKRMVRGGSWMSGGTDLQVSRRDRGTANKGYRETGFRLAKSL